MLAAGKGIGNGWWRKNVINTSGPFENTVKTRVMVAIQSGKGSGEWLSPRGRKVIFFLPCRFLAETLL